MTEIDSILDSVKKKLGLDPDVVTEFDPDIIDAINASLNTLTQIGVGPALGFIIHDKSETWTDFLGSNPLLNTARSYVFIRARLLFDPPQSSSVMSALQEQAKEYEWRLNISVESPTAFPTNQYSE